MQRSNLQADPWLHAYLCSKQPKRPTFQLAASVLSCGVSSRSGSSRILQQRQAALRIAELEN